MAAGGPRHHQYVTSYHWDLIKSIPEPDRQQLNKSEEILED